MSTLFKDLESLQNELPTSKGGNGKKSLYKPEVFAFHAEKFGRDAKQTRNHVRKEFLRICANVTESDLNSVNLFNRYYKAHFLVNDYTLASVTDKKESAQNTYDFNTYKRALAIAQKFANKK